MEGRIDNLEAEITIMKTTLEGHLSVIEAQKVHLIDQLNKEFTSCKLQMYEIVQQARQEFGAVRTELQNVYGQTADAVQELAKRIDTLEKKGPSGMKGYLPLKSMVPKEFKDQTNDWRQWQDDILDYLDNVNAGMRGILKLVEMEKRSRGRGLGGAE